MVKLKKEIVFLCFFYFSKFDGQQAQNVCLQSMFGILQKVKRLIHTGSSIKP